MNNLQTEFSELKKLTLLGAKNVLTIEEACMLTGLSRQYVYQLVWKKKIPYHKRSDGGRLYFIKSELEAWMTVVSVPTDEQLTQEAADFCAKNERRLA